MVTSSNPFGDGRAANGREAIQTPHGGADPFRVFASAAHRQFARRGAAPRIFGRLGKLEVCLAHSKRDVRRAQRLRYQVFYREMSATPSALMRLRRRDADKYDDVCDHLLVIDRDKEDDRPAWRQPRPCVIGTYRMLRQDVAERCSGFYSQAEYDLGSLIRARGPGCRFLEVGRSCVLQPYRNRRTVELLWHGLWTYAREHDISVMIGCASFEGTDPNEHAEALSFLHHNVLAPPEWRVTANRNLRVDMNIYPPDRVNPRDALRRLPPLIKGYLRLGCFVGDGAVVDHQFGTTDVLMILPVDRIDPRYFARFGSPDERTSRLAP